MKKRLFLTEEEDQTLYPDVTIQTFEEYLENYDDVKV